MPDYACHARAIDAATRRISVDLSRRGFIAGATASIASLGLFASAKAAPAPPSRPIVFTNFRLFDGTSNGLRDGVFLLVEGARIKAVGSGTPAGPERADDPLWRPSHYARSHRRALARIFCRFAAPRVAARRRVLHLFGRRCRGGAHVDARLHDDPRSRRPHLRTATSDRPKGWLAAHGSTRAAR